MTSIATSDIQTPAPFVECEALRRTIQATRSSVVEVGPRVRMHMKIREDLEADRQELPAGFWSLP